MLRLLPVSLCLCFLSLPGLAACIDVVDLDNELPAQLVTENGVALFFQYDLRADEYTLRWEKDGIESEAFGPFPLTMSCQTAALKWETEQFLLLERGCGTFCWYTEVFYLAEDSRGTVPRYRIIEKPLAFDTGSHLLAFYHSQDVIGVINLLTDTEQQIPTVNQCESYSGLCFGDVSLDSETLGYTWNSGQGEERYSVTLASGLRQR